MGYLSVINAFLLVGKGHATPLQLPIGIDTFGAACQWAIDAAPQYTDTAITVTDTSPGSEMLQRIYKFDSQRNCVLEMTRRKGWQPIPDLNMESR